MKTQLILLLGLIILSHKIYAQQDSFFIPDHEYQIDKNKLNLILATYKAEAKAVNIESKKAKADVIETINTHVESIKELHESGYLMYNDTLTRYLQSIANLIKKKSSFLDYQFNIFIGRSSVPNAYSYGQGIIIFNAGLLSHLKSEGEIAYVLAHEMSHDYLKHLWKRVKNRALILNDEAFKKELKNALKKEYNRNKAIDSVISIYTGNILVNSRKNELQADSLGLVLLQNAGYNGQQAIELLNVLDLIDYVMYRDSIELKKYLDFPEFPFKNDWLDYLDESSWGASKDYSIIPDSLKTHPNCDIRKSKLKEEQLIKTDGADYIISKDLSRFRELFILLNLDVLVEENEGSMASYQALHFFDKLPNEIFIKGTLMESYFLIWKAKKKYMFSKVVDKDKKSYPKSYTDYIHYLQNINSNVYANHVILIHNNFINGKITGEYADYLNLLLDALDTSDDEMKKKINLFKSKYGSKYYYKRLLERLYIEDKSK